LDKDKAFVFNHDFESSVPPKFLHIALVDMGLLPQLSSNEFTERLGIFEGSVVNRLKDEFQIDLDPVKIDLATTIAAILNEVIWWQDDHFMQETELGKFLGFIQRIY
jgi:hypothetical protein